ncbi:zinc ribbon domain-containing protein [Clostridiaceae bacterium 35-E11]
MRLFSKVKQGMLDSTKAIKEMSSDVTEITRLKVALSKDLAKMDELYSSLGKQLYAAYEEEISNNNFPEFPENIVSHMVEIQDTLSRIKEYEFKIESLKGIIKCSQCGYEIEEEVNFCANCGNPIGPLFVKEAPNQKEDTKPNNDEKDIEDPAKKQEENPE